MANSFDFFESNETNQEITGPEIIETISNHGIIIPETVLS
jgi:hypothetical protein